TNKCLLWSLVRARFARNTTGCAEGAPTTGCAEGAPTTGCAEGAPTTGGDVPKTAAGGVGALGPRQKRILEFILSTVEARGYPPSVREIAEAVGLASPSTVHAHLEALQSKGYIRKDPTKPRAIEIS